MGTGRRKEIERHLSEAELDVTLRDEEDPEMVRRLGFVKSLYPGDTFGEAADREGKSQLTGAHRGQSGGTTAASAISRRITAAGDPRK